MSYGNFSMSSQNSITIFKIPKIEKSMLHRWRYISMRQIFKEFLQQFVYSKIEKKKFVELNYEMMIQILVGIEFFLSMPFQSGLFLEFHSIRCKAFHIFKYINLRSINTCPSFHQQTHSCEFERTKSSEIGTTLSPCITHYKVFCLCHII